MPTVYITAPPDAATELARTLVEEQLAACVNQFEIQSVYRWEGEIHDDPEVALLAKTTGDRYDELEDRISELHPYDVPCIERFDEDQIAPAFEEWVVTETRGSK